jgi:hypothetical protein
MYTCLSALVECVSACVRALVRECAREQREWRRNMTARPLDVYYFVCMHMCECMYMHMCVRVHSMQVCACTCVRTHAPTRCVSLCAYIAYARARVHGGSGTRA